VSKIALFVQLEVDAAQRQYFMREMNDHAAKTLAGEAGCKQFDVYASRDDENTFLLYEVYADQAALEIHRDNPQLGRFRDATSDMVTSRRIVEGLALPA
jgi:quinol monooxygenase YgiN